MGILVDGGSNSTINGNTIVNFGGTYLYGIQVVVPSNMPGAKISGDVISGNTLVFPATGLATGIQVTAGNSTAVVSNNKINGNVFVGNGSVQNSVGIRVVPNVAGAALSDNDLSWNKITRLLY
jgi:hypothetical protein